jgi:hypothetical protein
VRDSLLRAYVAENSQLLIILSTHVFFLSGSVVETREFSGTAPASSKSMSRQAQRPVCSSYLQLPEEKRGMPDLFASRGESTWIRCAHDPGFRLTHRSNTLQRSLSSTRSCSLCSCPHCTQRIESAGRIVPQAWQRTGSGLSLDWL